jgi:methanogen homoisocitrate dehydrogenase
MSGRRAKKVAVVPGDGIGPEVVESALSVLDAAGAEFEKVLVEVGFGRWKRTGQALSDADMEILKECDCILFGAITTPFDPNYKSVLLRLRKELDLYANIRPFTSTSPDLDFIIVRENTEGLYSGLEEMGEEESRTVRVITRRGSERIAETACDLASQRRRLTIVHKSNVLKSDRLFLETCRAVAARRGVPFEDMLVDTAAYNLVIRPQKFDVLVTTNLFGDILSDEAAGIVGSLGLCASANVGESRLYSGIMAGPDIAGKGIANFGGRLKAAMMMKWLGYPEMGENRRCRLAVPENWSDDSDLGGSCSTEVTEAVINT